MLDLYAPRRNTAIVILSHAPAEQVETRNDQTYVAPALLPVLASSKSDTLRRQECLRHTILEAPYFVIGSAEREESRGFSSWQGGVGILHPLKRVQNDKVPALLQQKTKLYCYRKPAPAWDDSKR